MMSGMLHSGCILVISVSGDNYLNSEFFDLCFES